MAPADGLIAARATFPLRKNPLFLLRFSPPSPNSNLYRIRSTLPLRNHHSPDPIKPAPSPLLRQAPSINFQDPPAAAKKFIQEYKDKFGEEPNYPALLAYDAMMIIALAINEGGDSAEGIRDALYRVKDFPGVTGNTTIDHNGDATKPFLLKITKEGRFERFSTP